MNYLAVIALASSLLVSTFGLLQQNPTCSAVCKVNCNAAATVCRLVPGLTQACDTNQATCTGVCDTTCSCLDTCHDRCAGDFVDCVQGGDPVVDTTLCLATRAFCGVFCFPSCGVRLTQATLNTLISTVG